jgi:conjugative relaxase-like TrwC/TraI family protein
MRYSITALGSGGGRTVGQAVDAVVRYLEPRASALPSNAPGIPSGSGPASYYADRGTEPGRWLGNGSTEAGLVGPVDAEDFAKVLTGRDPATGARLITAQGSAGRRPTLGAGTETRTATDGTRLYDVVDLAACLGLSRKEAEGLVAAGEQAAIESLTALLSRRPATTRPAGSYVVPYLYLDIDGTRYITEEEISRVEDARARGTSAEALARHGEPDDQFSVAEAARLSGVTERYLRRLCRRYEQDRTEIDESVKSGRPPRRAYLVAWRGSRGRWRIKRHDLVDFLERRHTPAVRVGYDLTLTTEKSLGVLALLGDDRLRAATLEAIEAGNHAGLRYLEMRVLAARAKGRPVGVRGWTVATFRHLTSRALDPFPHHHNVVANTVVDEYGTRRALDARGLYAHAQEASALATVEMRHHLTKVLGVRWRPSWHGGWEIDGIDDEVLRNLSQRRGEIDEAVAELEAAIGRTKSVDELQSIVLATRPPKEEADPAELVQGWWRRARSLGLEPKDLQACTGRPVTDQVVSRGEVFGSLASPETGLCASSSIFTRTDVIVTLADLAIPSEGGPPQPLLASAMELEELADAFLASEQVVPLLPDPGSDAGAEPTQRYSTREVLGLQHRIADRFRDGLRSDEATVAPATLDSALESEPRLTQEQRDFVRNLCTSGDRIQCAIGRAGSGKTTTMRIAAQAWRASGYSVLGAAVKGEAARHLSSGAQVPAETLAWYLARANRASLPLDDKTVLVIDEASTVSDRDLDAVIALAERSGTAVRLVGDPAQHGAVAAGGMFRHLCQLEPDRCPELTVTHRLRNPDERVAAEYLRHGLVDEAIDLLDRLGHVHVAGDDIELYVGMLQRWWRARLAGDDHPMVDRRHHTRQELNRLARSLLRATGQLGENEMYASRDRAFATGDRVVARMAARTLHVAGDTDRYVRNGASGTVVALVAGRTRTGDRLRVVFDGIGTIDVPRSFFDDHEGPGGRRDVGIDHAYAVTSYAVQGATFETSTSRLDEHASRPEAYVDITRGRAANHIFLARSGVGALEEHLPRVPPPPLPDAVSARLTRSGPERAAISVDPHAVDPDEVRSSQRDGDRAAAVARHRTPPDLGDRLPEESPLPYLSQQRIKVIEQVAAYRATWKPGPTAAPWSWALGGPPTSPAMAADRESAAEAITALTKSAIAEALRPLGWEELPAYADVHAVRISAVGQCRVDPAAIDRLYRRLHALTADVTEPVRQGSAEAAANQKVLQLVSHEIDLSAPPQLISQRGR